jgi:hypothetical protein
LSLHTARRFGLGKPAEKKKKTPHNEQHSSNAFLTFFFLIKAISWQLGMSPRKHYKKLVIPPIDRRQLHCPAVALTLTVAVCGRHHGHASCSGHACAIDRRLHSLIIAYIRRRSATVAVRLAPQACFCSAVLYSIALFFNHIYSTVFFLLYSFPEKKVVVFEQAATGAVSHFGLFLRVKKKTYNNKLRFFFSMLSQPPHHSPCRYIRSIVLYAYIHFKMCICLTL